MIGVVRNGQDVTFEVEAFWKLARSRKLLRFRPRGAQQRYSARIVQADLTGELG